MMKGEGRSRRARRVCEEGVEGVRSGSEGWRCERRVGGLSACAEGCFQEGQRIAEFSVS